MKKFFKPIVLAILAGSLAVVSCTQDNRAEIDGIKAEIAAIKEKMAAGEVDVKAQISTLQYLLQAYKEEVNPKLTALDAQMKVDYAVLSEADEALSKALKDAETALLAKINKNSSDIAATNEEIQKAIAEYKKLVADAIAEFEAAIEKVKADQAIVDGVQNLALEALSTQISAYKASIDEAVAELEETVIAIGVAVEAVAGEVEEIGETLEELQEEMEENYAECMAYTDALAAAVDATIDALEERIAANEAAIEELTTEVIPEIEDAIEALEAAIEGLEGNVEALDGKKLDKTVFQAFLTQFNTWKAQTETRLENVEGALALFEIFQGVITKQVATLTNLVTVLNGDKDVPESVKNQIEALHALIIKDLEAMKTNLEAEIGKLNSDLEGVKADVSEAQSDITILYGMIEDVNGEIADINEAIETAQGDIEALKKVKGELEDELKALEETLDEKIAALAVLLGDVQVQVNKILGDKTVEGSLAYYVDQLSTSIQGLDTRITDNANAIAALQEEVAKLAMRIQSLVFVPEYKDLCFGIPFTGISDGSSSSIVNAYNDPEEGFTVTYKVAPANLAEILAKKVTAEVEAGINPIFAFDIVAGLKSTTLGGPQLKIMKAEGDDETGKITFHLSHEGFDGSIMDTYAVSLRADNDEFKVHVASEYVQTARRAISFIEIDKTIIYKANPLTKKAEMAFEILPAGPEMTKEIEYTDGIAYAYFAGLELGAKLTVNGEDMGVYTFSQLEAMGYEMPTPKITASVIPGGTAVNMVEDITKGVASTVSVKIVNGTEDNMKNTKQEIGNYREYNFAFNDGLGEADDNTVNAQLKVSIAKHKSAIAFNFPYETVWTYASDALTDHNNISAWTANYVRSNFVVKPTMTLSDGDYPLDGSNKVYGLEVTDFVVGQVFTPTETPADIVPAFKITARNNTDKELTLEKVEIKKRESNTYSVIGSYSMPYLADEVKDVPTTVTIKWADRKTDDIVINLPGKDVTLLKPGEYVADDDFYKISSDDFADALMTAYVSQGIFTKTGEVFAPTKEDAFSTGAVAEFANGNIKEQLNFPAYGGLDACFTVWTDATEHEFFIKSNDVVVDPVTDYRLISGYLHMIATNYENKPWTYSFTTYVGQKVTIVWPITVKFMYDYKFKTAGLNITDKSFSIPDSKVWPNHADITHATTELDLIYDSNIQIVEGNTIVPSGEVSSKHLLPKFKLDKTYSGVYIYGSKVGYYGQALSVGIKSSLEILSGVTGFLVPDSDKMYINNTQNKTDIVYVNQFNPIADPSEAVEPATIQSDVAGDIPVTMLDILGNKLYVNGARTTTEPNYKATVPEIFGLISFAVYSVNGNTTTTGWSIATPNNPEKVQLKAAASVATGTYTVVVKATTRWKTYDYTFLVTVI